MAKTAKINMYDEHPVLNVQKIFLQTQALQQLEEDIHRWVWTGSTGALVFGESRVGKSVALKYLLKRIFTRGMRRIPCFYMSIRPQDTKTIASIFRNLCFSEHLKTTIRDTGDFLSDRFIHHVADVAIEAECGHVILIVDEMQRLQLHQFDAFAEIYDNLVDLGIASTTIFAGNDPGCWSLIEQIETSQYAHIRGRFFLQGTSFTGLTSKNQVKQSLAQYDTLRFPEDGETYTGFFLPKEVAAGWKLASISSDLWRVFREYQREYKFNSFGMQYFVATTQVLLSDFLPRIGVENISDEIFHECFRRAGLLPSLVKYER